MYLNPEGGVPGVGTASLARLPLLQEGSRKAEDSAPTRDSMCARAVVANREFSGDLEKETSAIQEIHQEKGLNLDTRCGLNKSDNYNVFWY